MTEHGEPDFLDRVTAMTMGANSTQLNIVATVDVAAVRAGHPVEQAIWFFDNEPKSEGHGTPHLQTSCLPGQVINFLIYPVDGQRRPDGSYPDFPQIDAIVFYQDGSDTRVYKTLADLKVYGAPDRMRSPYTPVYRYWAGTVERDAEPGVYPYRMIISLPGGAGGGRIYTEVANLSIHIQARPAPGAAQVIPASVASTTPSARTRRPGGSASRTRPGGRRKD